MPVQTPLTTPEGTVSVPWLYYLMQFASEESSPPGGGGAAMHVRTLLLKNSSIGTDIADHVIVQADGEGVSITGVLRIAISADLTVRVNKNGLAIITITIPAATPIDTPITVTTFTNDPEPFVDGEVLSWDVTASGGEVDAAGVASFTLEWAVA
jgi:hypothetical protein